jgi:hypothetical protein
MTIITSWPSIIRYNVTNWDHRFVEICCLFLRIELLDCFFCFFSFWGWGETGCTWYVGRYLSYCTSPGWWWMMMSVEQSVKWPAVETNVLWENLPHCQVVHQKSHKIDRSSNPGRRVGNQRLTAWAMAPPSAFKSVTDEEKNINLHCREYAIFGLYRSRKPRFRP